MTGELGREIVVDPHTGRWYTVGDTGAEFVNIPRGAIVFNHKQTESLLKNGYVLKYYLEQSVNPSDTDDIPEDVIRAFITKIVAHKDGFDWYLRFSPDKPPKTLGIEGKRKNSAKVSSLCSQHHRLRSRMAGIK